MVYSPLCIGYSIYWHAFSDAEIRANVYKSFLLNSLSLVSIYVFDLLLYPLVKDQEIWYHRNIGRFYQVLWLLPVVGTSFYFNVSYLYIPFAQYSMPSRQHGARLLLNAHIYFSMVDDQHLFLRRPILAFWPLSQRQRIDWWWRLHLCSFPLG